MLIEFRFRNFLSFRDECVFSMVASKACKGGPLVVDNVVSVEQFGNRQLLRSAAVYGANASGKSNLVKAFQFVGGMVSRSAATGTDFLLFVPFVLDDESVKKPSEFELTFIAEGIRYRYGFVLDLERIHEEWLYAYPKGQAQKWFVRSLSPEGQPEWDWGTQLKGAKQQLADLTRPDALFLSVAVKFNQTQLQPVYNWLVERLAVAKSHDFPVDFTLDRLEGDSGFAAQVTGLLEMADLGILGVAVERAKLQPSSRRGRLFKQITPLLEEELPGGKIDLPEEKSVWFVHRTSSGEEVSFPYSLESEGTKRVFALAVALIDSLADGLVLVVDELDSSLHPLLVWRLIELFHNAEVNTNNAQLIFNTHDTTLLSPDLFRRDQIWFTEKDPDGASTLYSLLDFKPRKGEALGKGYLQGRYGAVPVLGSDTDWLAGE